jgi:hypothetical protein
MYDTDVHRIKRKQSFLRIGNKQETGREQRLVGLEIVRLLEQRL